MARWRTSSLQAHLAVHTHHSIIRPCPLQAGGRWKNHPDISSEPCPTRSRAANSLKPCSADNLTSQNDTNAVKKLLLAPIFGQRGRIKWMTEWRWLALGEKRDLVIIWFVRAKEGNMSRLCCWDCRKIELYKSREKKAWFMVLNKLRGQRHVEVKVHTQESGQTWVRLLALPSHLCKRLLPVSQLPHCSRESQDDLTRWWWELKDIKYKKLLAQCLDHGKHSIKICYYCCCHHYCRPPMCKALGWMFFGPVVRGCNLD